MQKLIRLSPGVLAALALGLSANVAHAGDKEDAAVLKQLNSIAAKERELNKLRKKHSELVKRAQSKFKAKKFANGRAQLKSVTGFCADPEDGKGIKGAKLIVWGCINQGPKQKRQRFTHLDTGQIQGSLNDLCWDLESGKARLGEPLILWACNGSGPSQGRQLFQYIGDPKMGQIRHVSGFCVDMAKKGAKGAQLALNYCHSKLVTQNWSVLAPQKPNLKLKPALKFAEKPDQLMGASGYCVDEESGKITKGGKVIVWTCNSSGSSRQRQLFLHADTGQIRASKNGLCLDVDKDKVILWTCNSHGPSMERQRFAFEKRKTGGQMRNLKSGKCLDVTNNGGKGGRLVATKCDPKNATQTWRVLKKGKPVALKGHGPSPQTKARLVAAAKRKGKAYCGVKFGFIPGEKRNLSHEIETGAIGAAFAIQRFVSCQGKYFKDGKKSKGEQKVGSNHLQNTGSWGFPLEIVDEDSTVWKLAELSVWSVLNGFVEATNNLLPLSDKKNHHKMVFACGSKKLKKDQTIVLTQDINEWGQKGGWDNRLKNCEIVTKKGNDWGW